MFRAPSSQHAAGEGFTPRLRTHTRIGIALLVALALVLPALSPLATPSVASAATQSQLDAARKTAEDARKKAAAEKEKAASLTREIADLEQREDEYRKQASALTDDISSATKTNAQLTAELKKLRADEQTLRANIATVTEQYQQQKADLSVRARETYKQGDDFIIEMLLTSQNLRDFLERTEFVSRLMSANATASQELEATRRQLESTKAELDRVVSSVAAKQKAAAANEAKLKSMQASRAAAAASAASLQDQKAGMVKTSEANAARLLALAREEEAEAARIERELRKSSSSGSGVIEGTFAWPTPGFYRVSSPYGYRIHPITGVRTMHHGIDIARNLSPAKSIDGASIVAAAAGTVLSAGYRSGYGNTIILDHGNGVTTLYAHQQAGGLKVSTGQKVKRGQRIGTVGSTGNSTGPHLHYEVRINGASVNPMKYY